MFRAAPQAAGWAGSVGCELCGRSAGAASCRARSGFDIDKQEL